MEENKTDALLKMLNITTDILKNNPTHAARTKHMDVKIKICGEVLAKKNKIPS